MPTTHIPALSPDQLDAIRLARTRAQKLATMSKLASFNGWTAAVFAALSAPFAWSSIDSILLVVGLAIVAFNEFRGRTLVRQFQPRGATLLGYNQFFFMLVLVGYFAWSMYHPGSVVQMLDGGEKMSRTFYASLIPLSVVFQGGNAIYYLRKRPALEQLQGETPPWVLELMYE